MSTTHILYFVVLSLFWGGSFLGIHYVVGGFPPAFGAFLRVLTAFLAVSFLMLFRPATKTRGHIKLQAMGAGVLNMGISWILLFYGEQFVSPALCSIYNSTSTIFAAIFAPLVLIGARLSKKNIVGVAIGFAGILMVFGPHIGLDDLSQIKGQAAIIGMAIFYGLGVTWVKAFSADIRATRSLFYQCIGALTVLGIYSAIIEKPWTVNFSSVPASAWIGVLYLAICSTFISWLIFIRLIRKLGAVRASSVTYLMPMVSIILDIIVLKKIVLATDIAGVLVIFMGVYLIHHGPVTQVDTKLT